MSVSTNLWFDLAARFFFEVVFFLTMSSPRASPPSPWPLSWTALACSPTRKRPPESFVAFSPRPSVKKGSLPGSPDGSPPRTSLLFLLQPLGDEEPLPRGRLQGREQDGSNPTCGLCPHAQGVGGRSRPVLICAAKPYDLAASALT